MQFEFGFVNWLNYSSSGPSTEGCYCHTNAHQICILDLLHSESASSRLYIVCTGSLPGVVRRWHMTRAWYYNLLRLSLTANKRRRFEVSPAHWSVCPAPDKLIFIFTLRCLFLFYLQILQKAFSHGVIEIVASWFIVCYIKHIVLPRFHSLDWATSNVDNCVTVLTNAHRQVLWIEGPQTYWDQCDVSPSTMRRFAVLAWYKRDPSLKWPGW